MTVSIKTMSIPECGRLYFGLSRNASYEAAKRGDIPTIRVGRLRRAVPSVLDRRLSEAGAVLSTEEGATTNYWDTVAAVEQAIVQVKGLREPTQTTREQARLFVAMLEAVLSTQNSPQLAASRHRGGALEVPPAPGDVHQR